MAMRRKVAIVLSGGGARAAYQVGVLRAIAESCGTRTASPFGIVTGTSAGAINALAIAAGAPDFRGATKRLCAMAMTEGSVSSAASRIRAAGSPTMVRR